MWRWWWSARYPCAFLLLFHRPCAPIGDTHPSKWITRRWSGIRQTIMMVMMVNRFEWDGPMVCIAPVCSQRAWSRVKSTSSFDETSESPHTGSSVIIIIVIILLQASFRDWLIHLSWLLQFVAELWRWWYQHCDWIVDDGQYSANFPPWWVITAVGWPNFLSQVK